MPPDPEYLEKLEEQRRFLRDAYGKNSTDKDKTVTALAGAALALSIAFLADIKPENEAQWVWVLVSAWVMFGLSLILILGTYVLVGANLKRSIDYIDAWKKVPKGDRPKDGAYRIGRFSIVTIMDNTSVVCFVAGVVLIVAFVSKNVIPG